MQNRWPMIAASLVVSLLLLFGGFFVYQKLQIENPMEETLAKTSHIQKYMLDASPNEITVRLIPSRDFSLSKDYIPLRKKLSKFTRGRELSILIKHQSEGELLESWNRINFGIQEGIALKRYTKIPQTVSKEAKASQINAKVFMDKSHVYIELKKDNQRLYRVLPLNKQESGVKDNG
ncbi:hypothetical protein SAMN05444487_111137 [Marininema mesophilum]|uniref:Uncharacterized protein n=1 Tax=Marininema mesophilum TaxID=1048340 RepID=A0A1H2ZN25_9BACL|nr:hypothetical protein [Marininema mesophilum]SDX18807.1 hypothetical protein SAMN05444487_111137 [Marininema mesophilum]